MDLRTFIGAMNWRDWIALIGFVALPLSALNAFFGLRSRYLDWQGPKSKVKFKKRLEQLSRQLALMDQYRKEPQLFTLKLLDDASTILVIFLASAAFCVCAAFLRLLNPPGTGRVPLGLALFFVFIDFFFAIKLSRLISRFRNPHTFVLRVISFLKEGGKKNLLQENKELVQLIINSETFRSTGEGKGFADKLKKHFLLISMYPS